jgi:3-oxoacyl-[acyl-carrier-protein] synthase-3
MTIEDHGNCGGPSVALTLTRTTQHQRDRDWQLMMLGYGVGLSWGSAVVTLDRRAELLHCDYSGMLARRGTSEP